MIRGSDLNKKIRSEQIGSNSDQDFNILIGSDWIRIIFKRIRIRFRIGSDSKKEKGTLNTFPKIKTKTKTKRNELP